MFKSLLLTVLLMTTAASCGKDKDSSTESEAKKKPDNSDVNFDGPTLDWAKAPLEKVSDVVDGIPFSIELPPRLEREEKKADDDFPGYVTWNGPNPFLDPSFTAQEMTFPPANLEAAESGATLGADPKEVLRSEELEGGGYLVSVAEASKQFLSVQVWRTSASTSKVVRFGISTRSKNPIEGIDELRAWMEKVVLSFAVE